MVPALIQYIRKSQKVADLSTANAIGTDTLTNLYDVTDPACLAFYDYVQKNADDLQAHKDRLNAGWMRILCYSGTGNTIYELKTAGPPADSWFPTAKRNTFEANYHDIIPGIQKHAFMEEIYLDQWIICCDGDGRIYVFVGGGCSNNMYHIKPDSTKKGVYHYDGDRGGYNLYMVYPEVSEEYMKLKSPKDARY